MTCITKAAQLNKRFGAKVGFIDQEKFVKVTLAAACLGAYIVLALTLLKIVRWV